MDSKNTGSYLRAANGDIWAIEAGRMRSYLSTLIVSDMDQEEIEARTGPRGQDLRKGVAVLPLLGPITQRAGLFTAFFGGTSTEKWGAMFDALVQAENVGAIVLDVDSPGGSVSGVAELAAKVFKARGKKLIVAVANSWAGSAAYHIASAADEVVVTPSGEVGSIGVWSMHRDFSEFDAQMGVKYTLISAGKFKVEANEFEPLTEEGRVAIQADVNTYYDAFAGDVAKFRGTTPGAVKKGYGEGRMVLAKEAVAVGLADRVGTLDQVIKQLGIRLEDREAARVAAAERDAELTRLEAGIKKTE